MYLEFWKDKENVLHLVQNIQLLILDSDMTFGKNMI